MSNALFVCELGYRAVMEEESDSAIWMAHALRRTSAVEVALLLYGPATHYVADTRESVLVCSCCKRTRLVDVVSDIRSFLQDGGRVFVTDHDLDRYGIPRDRILSGVDILPDSKVSSLVAEYEHLSFW